MKWKQASFQKKKIQNNDNEDNPRSLEDNGEGTRNVCQRPRRTKEQIEMNNTLEGINSRIMEAEESINDLEDRMLEILPQNKIQRKE